MDVLYTMWMEKSIFWDKVLLEMQKNHPCEMAFRYQGH